MNTRLYVGNLTYSVIENDLQDLFAQHGTVSEVHLMMDGDSGRSRGFAFVTMSTPEEGETACTALNGLEFQGRSLTVNPARPREARSSGGDRSRVSRY